MRKNLKKRLAMVLAAAMVFSTPVAVNNTVAGAAETKKTDLLAVYGMSSDKGINITTAEGKEAASIVNGKLNVPYQERCKGNVITLDADLSGAEGITLSFKAKADEKTPENSNWGLLASFISSNKGCLSITQTLNLWANKTANTGGTNTFRDVTGADLGIAKDKYSNITMTLNKESINVYRDGDLVKAYADSDFSGEDEKKVESLFDWVTSGDCKIVLGSFSDPFNWNWWDFAGSYDDVVVLGTALTAEEVKAFSIKSISVTGSAIKAEEGAKAIAYSFDAIDAPAGTGFEVSVSNGTETVTGSAVAADGGHVTYNYPEKGTLVSGTYTFKVTDVRAGENDKAVYTLDGDAADSVTVEVKDGVITGTKETVTVKLTDGKAALTADKKSIDYTFKAENAPAKGAFEYEVSKGDAVVATGSAAAVAEVKVNYAPTESGKYSFKVTRVTADESDKTVYALDGDAAAELDFTVSANPPATNPPATNPPATNPPATNPPAAGTVKKVTVKAANQKAGTKTVYLKKGGKVTLTATVTGTGKFSKAVKWSTSKKAVATVSSKGVVKAKKAGTAKITAASKTNKAKKATITIKVSKKAKKNKKLTLKVKKKNLKKGKTYTVAIKSMTKGTTDAVTYKTNKKKIATVDKFGVVKAKKKGSAVITVKCGKKKAKLTIKVK